MLLLFLSFDLFSEQRAHEYEPSSSHCSKPGIVVEHVSMGSEAAKVGLRQGDIVLKWRQGKSQGVLTSPFDVNVARLQWTATEPIVFEGLRNGKARVWLSRSGLLTVNARPDIRGTPLLAYLRARHSRDRNNPLSAARWFSIAGDYFDTCQDPRVGSWLTFQKATALLDAQLTSEANTAFEHAFDLAKRTSALQAATLHKRWGEWLVRKDELDAAEQALRNARDEANKKDSSRLLDALIQARLGWVDLNRGELKSALTNGSKARAILNVVAPNSPEFITTLQLLGLTHILQGNFTDAEFYLLQAKNASRDPLSDDSVAGGTLLIMGNLGVDRGDLAAGEKYYRQAMEKYSRVDHSPVLMALGLVGLGRIAQRRGRLRQAEKYYKSAIAMQHGFLTTHNSSIMFGNLGDVYLDLGDLAQAKSYYLQALAIVERTSPASSDLVEALNELGEVSQRAGKPSEAENYYEKALKIEETVIPGTTRHAKTLAGLAWLMRQKGEYDKASEYYERSIVALESQTARLGSGVATHADFRSRYDSYFHDYSDLLLLQRQYERALEVLERSRARTLLETLAAAHVDVRKGADPDLLDRERTLRADIRAKSERRARLLSEKHGNDAKTAWEIRAVEKQISELTSAYEDVEGQIRSSSPAYAALTQPQPLKAAEVQQQLLDKDTLLMEYSLGEERSHVFVVTPDSLQAFDLPKRADIERVARRAYRLIATRNRGVRGETPAQRKQRSRSNELSFSRAVAELSRMVLGPVASELQSKRLLIVPDGALAYIPFAVLPEPAITQDEGLAPNAPANPARNSAAETRQSVARIVDAANSTPLIVKHEIVNLPSASVLAVLRQQEMNRPSAPRAVAVLADPVFDKNDPRVRRRYPYPSSSPDQVSSPALAATRGASRMGIVNDPPSSPFSTDMLTRSAGDLGMTRNGVLALPRLRYSRQEADSILAVTPAGLSMEAVDFKANRAAATDPALAQYRIVHFATHGLLNSEHPELSGLVLSLVDEKGRPQDGFLELEDIYNLNLPADLVVLSACETGLGKEISGEGLVGLTRGFMYAGASRVMASLWKVSDAATAHLMAEFYKAMEQDGMRPAAALRAAQIEMLQQKRWSSPYFWAAFQIQGEWR